MKSIPAPDLAALEERLTKRYGNEKGFALAFANAELTLRVPADRLVAEMELLRDEPGLEFDQLIDLCGIDYSEFGVGYESLFTKDAMHSSQRSGEQRLARLRFAIVLHLLSTSLNHRLRIRVFMEEGRQLACPSVTGVWPCADWFEREAFDLFGIAFEGHPDLRRILTDYGFIGHPFRKDFPIYGTVEMRYDPDKGRVVYQPVSIEPREVVPRIKRNA